MNAQTTMIDPVLKASFFVANSGLTCFPLNASIRLLIAEDVPVSCA